MTIRWQPFDDMETLRHQIEDIFDEVEIFDDVETIVPQEKVSWQPVIALTDMPESLILQVQLPGLDPQYIDIQATRQAVLVAGCQPYPEQGNRNKLLYSEFAYGKFQRIVNLPVEINPDQIQSNYRNGLLSLMLPKAEHERRYTVKVRVQETPLQPDALDVASETVIDSNESAD